MNQSHGITPALIPHTQFHKGRWLLSVKRPSWYYFKARQHNPNKISSRDFIASLDPPLRKLVKFLHAKGIKTTPSCAGHDMTERNFEKIYSDLKKDEKEIRLNGLDLKDVETGKILHYYNKNYVLPWRKSVFVKELSRYQHKGVLGLHMGRRKKQAECLMALDIDGVKMKRDGNVVLMLTNEDHQSDIKSIWKKITGKVIEILNNKF